MRSYGYIWTTADKTPYLLLTKCMHLLCLSLCTCMCCRCRGRGLEWQTQTPAATVVETEKPEKGGRTAGASITPSSACSTALRSLRLSASSCEALRISHFGCVCVCVYSPCLFSFLAKFLLGSKRQLIIGLSRRSS